MKLIAFNSLVGLLDLIVGIGAAYQGAAWIALLLGFLAAVNILVAFHGFLRTAA